MLPKSPGGILWGFHIRKGRVDMTLGDCIFKCDELKPNQFLDSAKVDWINEVESMVMDEIINRAETVPKTFIPYSWEKDKAKELLVPDPYSELYIKYIFAQIDFNNAEINRYNNSVAMYNTSFARYAGYYRRNHKPVQRNQIRNYG